jgi:hypothetical protein
MAWCGLRDLAADFPGVDHCPTSSNFITHTQRSILSLLTENGADE